MDRLFYILVAAVQYPPDRAARMARSGVLRIFARGWLIERARTRRLRAELAGARRLAEMHRDAHRDWLSDGCGFEEAQLPEQIKPMPWEVEDA